MPVAHESTELPLNDAAQADASASQKRRASQQYTARCHVQDICNVLLASMDQPCPGSMYNVVDDNPAGRAEVMAFASKLLQVGPDAQVIEARHAQQNTAGVNSNTASDASTISGDLDQHDAAGANSGTASASDGGSTESALHNSSKTAAASPDVKPRKQAEKRVRNDKIKSALNVTLEFPTYVEGLSAIHRGDLRPFS